MLSDKYYIHKAANCEVVVNGKKQENSKLTDLSYGQFLEDGDKNWVRSEKDFWVEVKFEKEIDIEEVIGELKAYL